MGTISQHERVDLWLSNGVWAILSAIAVEPVGELESVVSTQQNTLNQLLLAVFLICTGLDGERQTFQEFDA